MAERKELSELKILVVDDQPIILLMMAGALQQLGFAQVDTAQSAELALARLESGNFDLILLDIEMDGMNGLELVKRIRCGQTGHSSATPVLVVTSHTEACVLGTAIALDVNGIVPKPVKPELLLQKINTAINGGFKARPRIGYEVIATDVVEPSVIGEATPVGAVKEKALSELAEGDLLARPVVTAEGKTLLNQGIRLNENTIARLQEVAMLLAADYRFAVTED